jgi:hypothetical protein
MAGTIAAPANSAFPFAIGSSATRRQGTKARVGGLRAPRPYVLRGRKRAAILSFRLPRRSLVVFEVSQLAPVCRPIGLFRVRGRAGMNRVRFAGRVAGRTLRPGTYELRARGLVRARVRVVILPRGATAASATEALAANACPSEAGSASASLAAATASPLTSSSAGGDAAAAGTSTTAAGVAGVSESEPPLNGDSPASGEERSAGGALGVFSPPDTAVGTLAFALLLAGIAAAILLLGAASLPQTAARDPRLATLVADRRLELALAGTMTLFLVTVAYLVVVN